MRNLWNTERSERIDSKNKSGITNPIKLSSIDVKRIDGKGVMDTEFEN